MAGITAHPNFLGIQAAIANIAVSFYLMEWRQRRLRFLTLMAFLIGGIVVVFLSGSRNALVVTGLGIFLVFWVRQRYVINTTVLLVLAIALLGVIMLATQVPTISDLLAGTPFDRGDLTNNRADAWTGLLSNILEYPLFGRGSVYMLAASENSYLRGWAAFGIFYFIGLCAAVIIMLKQLIAARNINPTGPMFFGICFAVVFAGFFDGTLEDRFSAISITLTLMGVICSDHVVRRAPYRVPRRGGAGEKFGAHRVGLDPH